MAAPGMLLLLWLLGGYGTWHLYSFSGRPAAALATFAVTAFIFTYWLEALYPGLVLWELTVLTLCLLMKELVHLRKEAEVNMQLQLFNTVCLAALNNEDLFCNFPRVLDDFPRVSLMNSPECP